MLIGRFNSLALTTVAVIQLSHSSRPTVNLDGKYVAIGGTMALSNGIEIDTFLGIPYAERSEVGVVPTPVKYSNDKSHQKCVDDSSKSIIVNPDDKQFVSPDQGGASISALFDFSPLSTRPIEDVVHCNQLDIYVAHNSFDHSAENASNATEKKSKGTKRVLIYIHGGMLVSESRRSIAYDPRELLRFDGFAENTIVVAVEYSLGWYGFRHVASDLSAENLTKEMLEENVFGKKVSNIAIHEMIQAVKWVQDNIHAFGGNGKDITLIGHSAGATLAQYVHLVLNEKVQKAYGLFPNPITHILLMGGSAALFDAVDPSFALESQNKLVDMVNAINRKSNSQSTNCKTDEYLISLPPGLIKQASIDSKVIWAPVIDGLLITRNVQKMVKSGNYDPNVKIMFVVSDAEASFFSMSLDSILQSEGFAIFSNQLKGSGLQDVITSAYPNHKDSVFNTLTQFATDVCFVKAANDSIKKYKMNSPVIQHTLLYQLADNFPLIEERLFQEYMEKKAGIIGTELVEGVADLASCFETIMSFLFPPNAMDTNRYFGTETHANHITPIFQKLISYMSLLPLLSDENRFNLFWFIQYTLNRCGSFHGLDQALLLNWKVSKDGIDFYLDQGIDMRIFYQSFGPVISFMLTGSTGVHPTVDLRKTPFEFKDMTSRQMLDCFRSVTLDALTTSDVLKMLKKFQNANLTAEQFDGIKYGVVGARESSTYSSVDQKVK